MPAESGPKSPRSPLPEDNDRSGRGGALAGLGFQFAAAIVLGVLGGNWIDGRYRTAPWGVLIGAATGFAAGLYSIIRAASGEAKREADADRRTNKPGKQ